MKIALTTAGCKKSEPVSPKSPKTKTKEVAPVPQGEPIKVGAVLSITGPASFLGAPESKTLEMFAEKINLLTGNKAGIVYRPRPVDDPNVRNPDITKARALLQWEPKVMLDEGLKETIGYFQEKMRV